MDYKRIYDLIIERARTRILTTYKERHHIIPTCMGGINTKLNKVDLTAKEHYLVHYLLTKIYPNNFKLISALWIMCNGSKKNRPNTNSRMYENARLLFRDSLRKRIPPMLGKKASLETKEKMRKSHLGHKVSDKCKQLFISRTKKATHHCNTIYQLNKQTFEIVGVFLSMQEAFRETGIHYNGIRQVLDGKAKTAGGFLWVLKQQENYTKWKMKK